MYLSAGKDNAESNIGWSFMPRFHLEFPQKFSIKSPLRVVWLLNKEFFIKYKQWKTYKKTLTSRSGTKLESLPTLKA